MDEENQQRIDADPKIRELKKKIEEARMRAKIFEAAKESKSDTLEELEHEAGIKEDKTNPLPSLRTFESDAKAIIRDNKESLVSMNLAETKRHPPHKSSAVGRALSTYLSILFIVAGITVFSAIYYFGMRKEPAPIVTPSEFLIQANTRAELDIAGFSRQQFLNALFKTPVDSATGTVVSVILSDGEKKITTEEFLRLISPDAPSAIVRALGPTFEAGFYRGTTNVPFVILQVDSFENAYASMLAWEKTLPYDLAGLIVSTATLGGPFTDEIVKNKDVRVWRSDTNALIYCFVDKNTLVITRDTDTLKGMLNKIIASKFVR